jgi:hypothetical protein
MKKPIIIKFDAEAHKEFKHLQEAVAKFFTEENAEIGLLIPGVESARRKCRGMHGKNGCSRI